MFTCFGWRRLKRKEEANLIIEIERSSIEDELPLDLIIEILLKVPTMILLTRMRCVCKLWRNIIDSSWFIDEYNISKINDSDSDNSYRYEEFEIWHYEGRRTEDNKSLAALISLNDVNRKSSPPTIAIFDRSYNFYYCGYGLFYSYDIPSNFPGPFLFNPLRGGEAMLLPYKNNSYSLNCSSQIFGIGFDITTATYKFIRVYQENNNKNDYDTLVVEIYALGTREWREIPIQNLPCPFRYIRRCEGTSAYGDVHWIAYYPEEAMLISFDTRQEIFKITPLPKSSSHERMELFDQNTYLGMIDFVSYRDGEEFIIDIWLLRGHNKMWEKLYTLFLGIMHVPLIDGRFWMPSIIRPYQDGRIVFMDDYKYIFLYNDKTPSAGRLNPQIGIRNFLYTGNLLSLKNYYGGVQNKGLYVSAQDLYHQRLVSEGKKCGEKNGNKWRINFFTCLGKVREKKTI